ncbi:CLUMA_CG016650, isoform A [Clunio marinus]|uniref:CLUMA_CG016650, isoform A n=1 Tax=Clunio marinus TaxID=568069 RepID=A0A1J1IYP8_9DIPT|nr:CLUMA_CG016650, isoform A [Clunio marinus]
MTTFALLLTIWLKKEKRYINISFEYCSQRKQIIEDKTLTARDNGIQEVNSDYVECCSTPNASNSQSRSNISNECQTSSNVKTVTGTEDFLGLKSFNYANYIVKPWARQSDTTFAELEALNIKSPKTLKRFEANLIN